MTACTVTQCSQVQYDQHAKAPRFAQFLNEIIQDEDVKLYLQRYLGMCLTGDITEQVLLIPWGEGSNGKSTLLDTQKGLMGDYATESPPDLLIAKRHESHPTEIMDLRRRRLVIVEETRRGASLRLVMLQQVPETGPRN